MATATITASIGPHFYIELAAAGLGALPISSGANFVNYDAAVLTPAQLASLESVIAAHNPATADPAQSFKKAMAAGVSITSTGTPGVSGVYGCAQPQDITGMLAMQSAVAAGVSPLPPYADSQGKHGTLTGAQVTAIATAIFQRVAAIDLWSETGTSIGAPGGSAALDAWLNGGATGAQPVVTIA